MIGLKLSSEANFIVPDVGVSVLPSLAFLFPQEKRKVRDSINPTEMENVDRFINFFSLLEFERDRKCEPDVGRLTVVHTWVPPRHAVYNTKRLSIKCWINTASNLCLTNATIASYHKLHDNSSLDSILSSNCWVLDV